MSTGRNRNLPPDQIRRRRWRRSLTSETHTEKRPLRLATIIQQVAGTEKRKTIFTILCWTIALTAVYAQALYQRAYLTQTDEAAAVAICILAAASMTDVGRAILGYIASIFATMVLVFLATIIPVGTAPLSTVTTQIVFQLWITVFFNSLFPLPFTIYLAATLVGGIAGERFL